MAEGNGNGNGHGNGGGSDSAVLSVRDEIRLLRQDGERNTTLILAALTELRDRADMANGRLDALVMNTGGMRRDHEERLRAIEAHLGLAK